MIPPALATNLDQIAGGWFASSTQFLELCSVCNAATVLGQTGAKREGDSYQFIPLANGTGLINVGRVVMGNATQLGLSIADLVLLSIPKLDG